MLFLLNHQVLDLGEAVEARLRAPQRPPSLSKAVSLGQAAAFAAGGFDKAHPSVVESIAVGIAMASDANCALFVVEGAQDAKAVAVRLAQAPLTTIVRLYEMQRGGVLTAGMINSHIWRLAAMTGAA